MYIAVRVCNTDGVSPCFRKLIFKRCIIKMYAVNGWLVSLEWSVARHCSWRINDLSPHISAMESLRRLTLSHTACPSLRALCWWLYHGWKMGLSQQPLGWAWPPSCIHTSGELGVVRLFAALVARQFFLFVCWRGVEGKGTFKFKRRDDVIQT